MAERGGFGAGLAFSDDELAELGATLVGGAPASAGAQGEAAPSRALSLTPTVRQFAFSPLDTLVEAAFARLEPRQNTLRGDWSALAASHGAASSSGALDGATRDQVPPRTPAADDYDIEPAHALAEPSPASVPIPPAATPLAAAKARPITARGLAPITRPVPTDATPPRAAFPDVIFCSSPPPDAALLQLDSIATVRTPVCVASVTPSYGEGFRVPEPELGPVSAAEDPDELENVELEEDPTPAAKPTPPAVPVAVAATPTQPRPAPPPAMPPSPPVATSATLPTPPPAAAPTTNGAPTGAPPIPGELDGDSRAHRRGKAWFETLFDENYLPTQPAVAPLQTARELEFLAGVLGLDSRSKLLDVGCGAGRHAIGLAARGHDVTGLDLSLPLLLRAAEDARLVGAEVRFLHEDMRQLAIDGEFDAAYCCATSFGYFDDETNYAVLTAIAKALRPRGRFLLDIVNRDYLVSELPTRVWWQGDGCMVLEEVDFNGYTSRLESHRSVAFEDGRQIEHDLSIRAYSLHEIGKLLHRAGFRVTEVSGSFHSRGHFLGAASRQLIVAAEKK